MAVLPHPWGAYASYQNALTNRSKVDDRAWGLEKALNSILEVDSLARVPAIADLSRIVANESRRSRYARALVAKFGGTGCTTTDCSGQLDARSDIERLEKELSKPSFRLLTAIGLGNDQADVAREMQLGADAFRARLARARALARLKLAA